MLICILNSWVKYPHMILLHIPHCSLKKILIMFAEGMNSLVLKVVLQGAYFYNKSKDRNLLNGITHLVLISVYVGIFLLQECISPFICKKCISIIISVCLKPLAFK